MQSRRPPRATWGVVDFAVDPWLCRRGGMAERERASRGRSSTIRLRPCFITEPTELGQDQMRPIQAAGEYPLRPLPLKKRALPVLTVFGGHNSKEVTGSRAPALARTWRDPAVRGASHHP